MDMCHVFTCREYSGIESVDRKFELRIWCIIFMQINQVVVLRGHNVLLSQCK